LPPHDVIIINAAKSTPTRLMVDRMAIPSTCGVDPAFAGFLRAHRILSRHPGAARGYRLGAPGYLPQELPAKE
jgi:hypothetical protein